MHIHPGQGRVHGAPALGHEPADHPGKHVAAAAGGQKRVAGGVYPQTAVRDRPPRCGLPSAPPPHRISAARSPGRVRAGRPAPKSGGHAQKPGRLARMGGEHRLLSARRKPPAVGAFTARALRPSASTTRGFGPVHGSTGRAKLDAGALARGPGPGPAPGPASAGISSKGAPWPAASGPGSGAALFGQGLAHGAVSLASTDGVQVRRGSPTVTSPAPERACRPRQP